MRFRYLCLLAAYALSGAAFGQESYPDHPIKLVVAFSPGSAPDIMSRAYGEIRTDCEKFGRVIKDNNIHLD